MTSTSVTFDTSLFSSYNPTLKDTCVSTVAKCNGTAGYTDKESALGFSSSKSFTDSVLIITTTGADKKHTLSKGTVPPDSAFVSLLPRNRCYSAQSLRDGVVYYIRVDGTPCHIVGGAPSPLCDTTCCEGQSLADITNGVSYTNTTVIPKCVASDGTKTFLGYIAPNTFTNSNSINVSNNATDNDNCGSTGSNCNGQSGYSGNAVLGFVDQTMETKTIGGTPIITPTDDTESTPIWRTWWFWLIIGGIVLLIIIIIIIIVVSSGKKDDDSDGDIDPMMMMMLMNKK